MKKNTIGFGCLFIFLFIFSFSLSAQENVSRQTVLNTPTLLLQAEQRMDAARRLVPRQERTAGYLSYYWPISGSSDVNADVLTSAFGPRDKSSAAAISMDRSPIFKSPFIILTARIIAWQ